MANTDTLTGDPTPVIDMKDPFHASITPQAYATGAATVIAWMLLIMLLITPRTFYVGSGRGGLLGRRGMIGGAYGGGGSIIGVGSRPWLQKVAALTVAISMTIATADTFTVAQRQYATGVIDALALRDEVVGGLEIQISRVISQIFLWLAQVQTLIRLFPRHKEKVIIKWTGFALIVLDTIFGCLNSFMGNGAARPQKFVDAIPALSYLFQLALGMLYAAWVLYYAITKRRYSFYHPMMWNMSIIALLSTIALLTPVVFFITDISNYTVAGWGDYFRWVGAAAASVIVWEWVERIETLEREEKKDGILGREVFDGDEMLEVTPSEEIQWPRHRHDRADQGGGAYSSGAANHGISAVAHRFGRPFHTHHHPRTTVVPLGRVHSTTTTPVPKSEPEDVRTPRTGESQLPLVQPPDAVASPVSRTETSSADSTVYAVHYHPIAAPPIRVRRRNTHDNAARAVNTAQPDSSRDQRANATDVENQGDKETPLPSHMGKNMLRMQALNPFKRMRVTPPPEIRGAAANKNATSDGPIVVNAMEDTGALAIDPAHMTPGPSTTPQPMVIDSSLQAYQPPSRTFYSKWDIKGRLGAFAAEQGERFRENALAKGKVQEVSLPVYTIPAQEGDRTWSPENLRNSAELERRVEERDSQQCSSTAPAEDGDQEDELQRRGTHTEEPVFSAMEPDDDIAGTEAPPPPDSGGMLGRRADDALRDYSYSRTMRSESVAPPYEAENSRGRQR